MSNVWLLCESLVATVARAFYTDQIVVVLDALVREKYIMEEELGPRLKMTAKEIRRITTQLESEMLIKFENVFIDDNRSFIKCYYIDYKLFFHSILYRVHLMQKALRSEEKSELSEVFYQCPTCKEKSSSLMAMRMRNSQGKFLCSHCCPADNFRTSASEAYYTLEEVDNRGKLSAVQSLEKKMKEQLGFAKDLHDGIFSLLSQLIKVANIPTNLPSENIKVGIRSSTVIDADVAEDIKQNMQFATGQFGSSLIRKPTAAKSAGAGASQKKDRDLFKTDFDINIVESEEHIPVGKPANNMSGIVPGTGFAAARNATLPEFLRDSRVIGAASMMKAAEAMQEERSSKRARIDEVGPGDGSAVSNDEKKEENEAAEKKDDENADNAEEGADDDDDVDWED